MGLSVEKIGLFCNLNNGRKNNSLSVNKNSNVGENRETNLNYSPNNLSFGGLFFNKPPKKATIKTQPPCLYGPYSLPMGVLKENDSITYNLLEPVAKSLSRNNPKNLEAFSYDTSRATNQAINSMVPVCISLLACYPQTQTVYPEFHDSIARAFPKACARLDKELGTGNMSKLYFKVRNKLEEYGKAANPNSEAPIEEGIKYIYFADNIPLLQENGKAGIDSTDTLFDYMRHGYIPKLSDTPGQPRCSMSRAANEINEYGTPYIKEHFCTLQTKERGQEIQYQNSYGERFNYNYHHRREPVESIISTSSSSHDDDDRFDIIEPAW